MRLELSARADADIIDCYLYGYRTFGPDQAERYEQGLRQALDIIAENPRIAHERPEFRPPVRVHHHAKHYIIYLIEADRVFVLRVLRDEVELTSTHDHKRMTRVTPLCAPRLGARFAVVCPTTRSARRRPRGAERRPLGSLLLAFGGRRGRLTVVNTAGASSPTQKPRPAITRIILL